MGHDNKRRGAQISIRIDDARVRCEAVEGVEKFRFDSIRFASDRGPGRLINSGRVPGLFIFESETRVASEINSARIGGQISPPDKLGKPSRCPHVITAAPLGNVNTSPGQH